MQLPLLFALGTTEILLIIVVVLILFGGKKIPELMRGAGRGIREFKTAMNEPTKEEKEEKSNSQTTTPKEETNK